MAIEIQQPNANWVEVDIATITKNLDKRGITYEIINVPVTKGGVPVKDENGNTVMHEAVHIISVPPEEQAFLDFIAGERECWFEGCEELRRKYREEYDAAGGDEGCTSCQKNKIMRKYARLVKEATAGRSYDYESAKYNGKVGAGSKHVPGPGAEGTQGAGGFWKSLLRRATSRARKILRACTE